ncbi:MAG: hypothetical protein ABR540_16740 [Acidimicrobiales bacterium]
MRAEVVKAFVNQEDPPDDASLSVTRDILLVDRWWPAALWLGPATCLVRTDDGPDQDLPAELAEALSRRGLMEIEADLEAPVLSVTMQRVDVIAGSWTVWSVDEATARQAVGDAATG